MCHPLQILFFDKTIAIQIHLNILMKNSLYSPRKNILKKPLSPEAILEKASKLPGTSLLSGYGVAFYIQKLSHQSSKTPMIQIQKSSQLHLIKKTQ